MPVDRFPLGFVKADCDLDPALWVTASMPGWNADWTTGAVMTVPSISVGCNISDTLSKQLHDRMPSEGGQGQGQGGDRGDEVTCDEWVEHPVLIVQRDTFANFFHDRYALPTPPSPFIVHLSVCLACCLSVLLSLLLSVSQSVITSIEEYIHSHIYHSVSSLPFQSLSCSLNSS